jgi:hypothetical protein
MRKELNPKSGPKKQQRLLADPTVRKMVNKPKPPRIDDPKKR